MESSGFAVTRDEEIIGMDIGQAAIFPNSEGEQESSTVKKDHINEKPHDALNWDEDGNEDLLGQVVNSENEAFKLYTVYGHRMGFSVRRGKQTYFTKTDKIRTKDYYCSKEGFKLDERANESSYNRLETRTGCKAMVRFTVDEDGKWKVTRFIAEHNHELAKPEERHMLRSARSATNAKVGALLSMVDAGISTVDVYSYVAEEVGGAKNPEFSYHYVNIQNKAFLEAGELQSLVNYFKRRAGDEGMFYWDMQVDQEGRLTNFFWRDGRSRIDYDCFGDVVIFDTANRTNKYNLICAPFVGVNHHLQNVTFGCAFLSDDTRDSFVWLFKTFLESMDNRAPKTIFTCQGQAIANAIEQAFPTTFNRICLWNLSKNAPSDIGTLKSNKDFRDLFHKCLEGCDSETEFEETWRTMISKYNCEDHEWLNDLYKSRHKWCTALNNSIFHAGIKSSERMESTNNVLNGLVDKTTSLTDLILVFEKLVKCWRQNEAQEDIRCNHGAPELVIKQSDMLKHAASFYTHKIYKLFENEFLDGCGATFSQEIPCAGNSNRFELIMQGQGNSKVSLVNIDTSTMDVSCTCKKFESEGILCSHALKALSQKNVNKIPERYITKRWTKDARKKVHKVKEDVSPQQPLIAESDAVYRNRVMRYAYYLVKRSQVNEEARKIVWDALEGAERALETHAASPSLDANSRIRVDVRSETDSQTGEKDAFPASPLSSVRHKQVSKKRAKSSSEGETHSSKSTEKRQNMERTVARPLVPKLGPPVAIHAFLVHPLAPVNPQLALHAPRDPQQAPHRLTH